MALRSAHTGPIQRLREALQSLTFRNGDMEKKAFAQAALQGATEAGYSAYRSSNRINFKKTINTGHLLATYFIDNRHRKIICSIAYFNEDLHQIRSLTLPPDVDKDGRWLVSVNALSFPTYSHVWHIRISPFRTEEWHARKVTANLGRATVALEELCSDLRRLHHHLIQNDDIGEQLNILVSARLETALTLAIYLRKPETIVLTLEIYWRSLNRYGTAEGTIDQAILFLEKAYAAGHVDNATLDAATEWRAMIAVHQTEKSPADL